MQAQEVISVNIWLILISLCNLLILFLILKKFLFKPVQKTIADRQAEYDAKFAEADEKLSEAEKLKVELDEKLSAADDEADSIIKTAKVNANRRGDDIIADAKARADVIVKNAEAEAELQKRKAEESIRDEIADVSVELAEKLVGREISEADHRRFMDEFIDNIGDGNDADE